MCRILRRSFCYLAVFVLFPLASGIGHADESTSKPDIEALRQVAAKTKAGLESGKAASWTMVHEVGGTNEIHVTAYRTEGKERYSVFVPTDAQPEKLMDLIIRDGVWYVVHGKRTMKCRPYEAPVDIPIIYPVLVRSSPQVVDVDYLESRGTLEKVADGVATYRTAFPATIKKQLETSLRQLENFSQTASGTQPRGKPDKLLEVKRELRDLLTLGVPVKIDLQTGLLVQAGIPGKRLWLRDFKWSKDANARIFDVNGRDWDDMTRPMKADDPSDFIMIKHSALWRPGQPPGQTEARVLNIRTGECRRVPFQGMDCMPICFSKDRRRLYVGGTVVESSAIGLFEIDVETLAHRQLGLPLLDHGFIMFGAVSPDGRTVAVTQAGTGEEVLQQQIVLVDIATGKAKPVGKPLDCAYLSWLPDGSGLIMVSRKTMTPDQPSEGTVARMDLDGRLTLLVAGENPFSLEPNPSIMFQRKDKVWMTCDLNRNSQRQLLDGLAKFGFPAPAPDGNRVLMMKFGGPDGPRPYVINLKSSETTPVNVPAGIWAMPVWR